jgi:hypothetical protein
MSLQHLTIRFSFDGESKPDLARAIEVFHGWVSAQSVEGLSIDVADYRHVPDGPGVVLVGLEGDYYLNDTGLRYTRKAAVEGSSLDALKQAFHAGATACARLEAEFDGLKFCRKNFEIAVNDRAIAPNTRESFEQIKGDVESFFTGELGAGSARVSYCEGDPRKLLTVKVELDSPLELAAT